MLSLLCSLPLATLFPCLYAGPTYSIVLTIVHSDSTSILSLHTTIATIATLAKKHSIQFLKEVVHPRGITLIEDSNRPQTLQILQQSLSDPSRLVLKQALGNAFVELDVSEVAKVLERWNRTA
jgi:hypothetical protein